MIWRKNRSLTTSNCDGNITKAKGAVLINNAINKQTKVKIQDKVKKELEN